MIPDDLKELLRAFNEHAVKYLIVGGYAFGVHAEPRATKDLDIFIRSDEENGKAVFRALTQYGAPLADLTPADLMDGTLPEVLLLNLGFGHLGVCRPLLQRFGQFVKRPG